MRWRRTDESWSNKRISFGRWGHREGLWDDRVEAWFALVEGDGKRPVGKLLAMEPLNPPDQEALIGFLVIHMLRDPSFVIGLRHHLHDMMDEAAKDAGMSFEDMARAAYATLFNRNDLYHYWSAPIVAARWAIVSSEEPVFVLPDSFCVRAGFGEGYRMIVPLTPTRCFVTLAETEDEKRVVPHPVEAEPDLARQISNLLVGAARLEFLSHETFNLVPNAAPSTLEMVLKSIEARIR